MKLNTTLNTDHPTTQETAQINKKIIIKKEIKSFAIRSGRMTNTQKAGLSELMPKYSFKISDQTLDKQKIINYINNKPTIIEIGFGMGDAFICHAKKNIDLQFIGIEVHAPGVGNTLNLIEKHNISNCRIIKHDAIEILKDFIPNNSITGLQLFFPDPWPKQKHHKRRIVNSNFLELIQSKIKDNGYIYMATDWEDYAIQMHKLLEQQSQLQKIDISSLAISQREQTKFERRAEKLGHTITDLIYQKCP